MTVARSVADVLANHVTFELECIDRVYLNLYQPKLVYPTGVVGFFKHHRGMPIASGALMGPMTDEFVRSIHRYVAGWGLDLIDFAKGQRKDDVAQGYLADHDGSEAVLFVGRAQEKARVFRTEKRVDRRTGSAYPWLVKTTAMVNHFYFYAFDDDFGPFFIKFSSYFPYTAKVCFNGHHFAQRQAAKAGVGFEALDNGFLACQDPAALAAIARRLSAARIDAFCRKWLRLLPHPFSPADRRAGYRYAVSVLQAEFSLTQVLDRPLSGRLFFEEVIRDNLDAGRADQVSLIFSRRVNRTTPGRFRTRVITEGVMPSLHVDYKHSGIKQYFKLERALRTECTVNDTTDFGIGRLLHNLPALWQVGFAANRRLLEVQRTSSDPIAGADAYDRICRPVTVDAQRAAALRFDAPVTQALLQALIVLRLLHNGFANRDLRALLAPLLGLPPAAMTQGRMTYHLRRLRLHGLIERIPHTHRYSVTDVGLAAAIFLTRIHHRVLHIGMAHLADPGPSPPAIRRALDNLNRQIDHLTTSVVPAA